MGGESAFTPRLSNNSTSASSPCAIAMLSGVERCSSSSAVAHVVWRLRKYSTCSRFPFRMASWKSRRLSSARASGMAGKKMTSKKMASKARNWNTGMVEYCLPPGRGGNNGLKERKPGELASPGCVLFNPTFHRSIIPSFPLWPVPAPSGHRPEDRAGHVIVEVPIPVHKCRDGF